MRAVVQRVLEASVMVDGVSVGQIDKGCLVFLAIEKGDGDDQLDKMVRKVARLRIFPDDAGRMNLSVKEAGGALLVVSQFTLAADMKKGYRPSFGKAEQPELAEEMVKRFCTIITDEEGIVVEQGQFGADMKVHLVNDGPVTIWLDFPPISA
ncbi:MAG: D-tyrosyl-tRNA(Tyr) deacylase [Magnetococcales bacterium]|nr:D-tyrosyl-tRNA(Tyr) deacylase [Magnetococcales bacterium]